jgi:phage gpG-like protein
MTIPAGPLEAEEFEEELSRLAERLDNEPMPVPMGECIQPLLDAFRENFDTSSDADRSPWPARKNPKPTHPLLILTGALEESATMDQGAGHVSRVMDREMELGTDLIYAATHQFGDESRNIAQREFLAISEETADGLVEVIAREVEHQLIGE